MNDDLFDGPATTTGVTWADHLDRLLLIKPLSAETIMTAFGESNAVRADVTVLDGASGAEEYLDTLIFPKVLAGSVRPNIGSGRMNLGRLGRGNAKPGQTAPWILTDPTDADKAVARAHLAKAEPIPF